MKIDEKVIQIKEKIINFYKDNEHTINYFLVGAVCIFLGYVKGKESALNKIQNLNFNIRVKDYVREGFSN